jgi:hyperosmotically inducible protein
MKHLASLLCLAAIATGCDKPVETSTTQTTASTAQAADNTRNNTRDRNGAMTPLDQGNGRADLDTTQAIRKAVMSDDSLSSDAKNVKIITNGGVVTLRGPVKTDAEKRSVEAKALASAGPNRVDDQLDVETK